MREILDAVGVWGETLSLLGTLIQFVLWGLIFVPTTWYFRGLRKQTQLDRLKNDNAFLQNKLANEESEADDLKRQLVEAHTRLPDLVLNTADAQIKEGNESLAGRTVVDWFYHESLAVSALCLRAAEWVLAFYPDSPNPKSTLEDAKRYVEIGISLMPNDQMLESLLAEINAQLALVADESGDYINSDRYWDNVHRYADPQALANVDGLAEIASKAEKEGNYRICRVLYHRIWTILRRHVGPEDLRTLGAKSLLGWSYWQLSGYEQAEKLFADLVEEYKTKLGSERKVAQSMFNLGAQYTGQARFAKAETIYGEGLAIFKKVLGTEHPETAFALNNLATIYNAQGRYADAEVLHIEALAIRRKKLDKQHPDIANSLGNLASVCNNLGRWSEAESMYLEALEICRTNLGQDHPETASKLHNLASLYDSLGHYSKAEEMYLEVLQIRSAKLGQNHPDTALTLNNLGVTCFYQGRYDEAETYYHNALEIRRKMLFEDHPDIANSLSNIANLCSVLERYPEAEQLSREALEKRRNKLGEDHPKTASSMIDLASVYNCQKRYAEAEPLLLDSICIMEKRLGKDSFEIASPLNNLAYLCEKQERFAQAESLYLKALGIRRKSLGEDHPDTILIQENIERLRENSYFAGLVELND